MEKKVKVKLSGQDGNVFNLIGICSKALKKAGQAEKAKELRERATKADSYMGALAVMGEYCQLS